MAEDPKKTYGLPPRLRGEWDEFLKATGPRLPRVEVMLEMHVFSFFGYLDDKGVRSDELSLAMLGDAERVEGFLRFLDVRAGSCCTNAGKNLMFHIPSARVLPNLSNQVARFIVENASGG